MGIGTEWREVVVVADGYAFFPGLLTK